MYRDEESVYGAFSAPCGGRGPSLTLRKTESEERYFTEKIPPEDRERFQKLSSLHLEISDAEEEDLFAYAFSLGMLLTLDVTGTAGFDPPGSPEKK